MKKPEGVVVTGILCVLLFTWLGFLVHHSPRFAGTGVGSAFGIAGAFFMLVPLAYMLIKRIRFLNARITPHVSLQSWEKMHVYAGIFGPLLGIIHTGHKFDSMLGSSLTAVMLLVVVSGFTGGYLLTYVNQDSKDKLLLLQTARGDLDSAWGALKNSPPELRTLPKSPLLAAGFASLGIELQAAGPAGEVTRLAEAVADLEYSIHTHELFKRWSSRWLKMHLTLSMLFYVLLGLHIWAGIHFGLRWFS
jgi:hypothetical protein